MAEGALRPGDLIADTYQIERHVGGGGMGQVYAATDQRTGAQVALKLLSMDHADQRDLDRFQREVELAARVDRSAGVVRVHAVGTFRGRPYCVMEFVEGQDLQAILERGALDCERACELLGSVARTLAACHGEGVIHRDLKPANIMIQADGETKVADFGLARDMAGDGLTRTGELVGTPAYMAPEQATDASRAVDGAVDVYSLGAVLYHALTGQPPFMGTSVLQVLSDVTSREPPRPRSLRPDLPVDLEAVCLRAMAKDPAERYPSMTALADDLDRAARGSQVDARPISAWERLSRRLAQREPTAVAAAVGATLLVVVAVLGAAWVVLDGTRRRKAPELLAAMETYQREVLDPWALGIGASPPPGAAGFLSDQATRLARMGPYLPAEDRARAAELAKMFSAQGRLLEGRLAPEQDDTYAAAMDAVLIAREGDFDQARERLAPAQRAKNPLASRAWSALWHVTLQRYGAAESLECLKDAPRAGKLPPEGEEVVRQAAVLLLSEVFENTLRSDSTAFADLESAAQTAHTSLERALPSDAADAAWVTVRKEALARTAKLWTEYLAGTAPKGTAPTPPRELLEPVEALRSLLRSEPPIGLPPEISDALSEVFRRAVKDLDAPPPLSTQQRVSGWWAMALETVAFYQLGWRCPHLDSYEQFLRDEMRISAPPVPRTDLLVAVARHGVLLEDGEVIEETLVDTFAARAGPLAFAPPATAILRWIELERTLHRTGRRAFESPNRENLLGLAGKIFEAGIDDLAPPYRARARQLLCKLLRYELERAPPSEDTPRLAAALRQAAEHLMSEAVDNNQISESFHALAKAASISGREFDLRGLGLGTLETLRSRARAPSPKNTPSLRKKRRDDQKHFLEFLIEYARHLGDEEAHAEADALLREGHELATRFELSDGFRLELVVAHSDLLRDMRRPRDAEALLQPWLEQGLRTESKFAREAVRVAIALGNLEEARRRLEIAEANHTDQDALQDARRRYERKVRESRDH